MCASFLFRRSKVKVTAAQRTSKAQEHGARLSNHIPCRLAYLLFTDESATYARHLDEPTHIMSALSTDVILCFMQQRIGRLWVWTSQRVFCSLPRL